MFHSSNQGEHPLCSARARVIRLRSRSTSTGTGGGECGCSDADRMKQDTPRRSDRRPLSGRSAREQAAVALRGLLAVSLGLVASLAVVGLTRLTVGASAAPRLGPPVTDCGVYASCSARTRIGPVRLPNAAVQNWMFRPMSSRTRSASTPVVRKAAPEPAVPGVRAGPSMKPWQSVRSEAQGLGRPARKQYLDRRAGGGGTGGAGAGGGGGSTQIFDSTGSTLLLAAAGGGGGGSAGIGGAGGQLAGDLLATACRALG